MSIKYNRLLYDEAVVEARNIETNVNTLPQYISSARNIVPSVNVSNLDFLSDSSYNEMINIVSNYSSKLLDIQLKLEKDIIIECVQNGNTKRLIECINNGIISTQAFIEYSRDYMYDGLTNGNALKSGERRIVIGKTHKDLNEGLSARGLSDDFINNLSNEFCKYLINNDLMYTKKGTVEMSMSFLGMMSTLGISIAYDHREYDDGRYGFYFGDGIDSVFSAIDCCNYTDWIARCVGVHVSNDTPSNKATYCDDGITLDNQIRANIDSEYYTQGEGGDYLITPPGTPYQEQHIMMIIKNDGKGYYFVEAGAFQRGGSDVKMDYVTYEGLASKGYTVTNTDALFRNTAPQHQLASIMYNEDGTIYTGGNRGAVSVKLDEVFVDPNWIINQKNINLTMEEQQSLIEQYSKRNKLNDLMTL